MRHAPYTQIYISCFFLFPPPQLRYACVTLIHNTFHIAAERLLEELPKAPPPEPRKLTETELKRLNSQEEATMRELRLFLRDCLNKLGRDRKFAIFAKPVDEEEVNTV